MIQLPAVVGEVVRSVGLSAAMRAAGMVTSRLPIPQPTLLVGAGASRRLGELLAGFGHRRILVVTDRVVSQMGLADALLDALEKGGTGYVVFDDVTADAPIPMIESGIAFYRKHGCDAIVPFGGGSPMDTAKTIALAVANDTTFGLTAGIAIVQHGLFNTGIGSEQHGERKIIGNESLTSAEELTS